MDKAQRPDWSEVSTERLLTEAADRSDASQRPATAGWLRFVLKSGTDEQKTAAIGVAEIIMGEGA